MSPESKDPNPSQELITGVPAELGGGEVRTQVEANQQARQEELAKQDQTETFLGASSVTSQMPRKPETQSAPPDEQS